MRTLARFFFTTFFFAGFGFVVAFAVALEVALAFADASVDAFAVALGVGVGLFEAACAAGTEIENREATKAAVRASESAFSRDPT
jgi:hypothetical protein